VAAPLALRQQRPVVLPGGQLRTGSGAGAASAWAARPLRPELAAVSRPAVPARGRAPLFRPRAWMASSQIASSAFTWGTIAVLPFYTLMVVAPNADVVRIPQSSNPHTHNRIALTCSSNLSLCWRRPSVPWIAARRTSPSASSTPTCSTYPGLPTPYAPCSPASTGSPRSVNQSVTPLCTP
jgi:hypothetical protein